MLLGSVVRGLGGCCVSRPLGASLKHASFRRALCIQLQPRPFEVTRNCASLFQIRLPRSCKDTLLRVSPQSQSSTETRLRMGWACASCTFFNVAGSGCGVCSEPAPGVPTYVDAEWTCEACTFVNIGDTAFCEMCDNGRLGVSKLGTSFRPLRASARLDLDAPVKDVEIPQADCIFTSHTGLGDEAPQVASGSTNPKSRKRKAKEEEVIDLSEFTGEEEVPDGKKKKGNGGEPNHLLMKLYNERMSRLQGSSGSSDIRKEKIVISLSSLTREQKLEYIEAEGTWLENPSSDLTVLSYNVWFREDLEVQARLEAIGEVILHHRPHIVFFQEVTENIYKIFQRASWWKSYECSVKPGVASQRAYFCLQLSKLPVISFKQSPFRNSVMGRELCLAEVDAGKGARLLVATSHLESPCPAPPTWNQMFSPERVAQAKEAMLLLKEFPNVIFGGDMNWDDKKDGPPPLPLGWFDAWLRLRPGQEGFTYDTKANRMLSGNRSLQKRLDRMFCKLRDYEALSIEMVGTEAIPDLTYGKEKKVKGQLQMIKLPVLPSDHFGLLLKLRRKST